MQNGLEIWHLDANYQWVTVKTEGLTQWSCTVFVVSPAFFRVFSNNLGHETDRMLVKSAAAM